MVYLGNGQDWVTSLVAKGWKYNHVANEKGSCCVSSRWLVGHQVDMGMLRDSGSCKLRRIIPLFQKWAVRGSTG